ncbi:unnamed protein product [Spodoptera exigua]|nr:unnamed protein product [Spodoptera exigua]
MSHSGLGPEQEKARGSKVEWFKCSKNTILKLTAWLMRWLGNWLPYNVSLTLCVIHKSLAWVSCIGWRTTNAWLAGNLACKFFLVLRAFGLYLSSNVLVCISLDRFFAILYPLRLPIARKRSKIMLSLAWIIALLCSLPQSLVFRVMSHPKVPDFQQCVSFEAFANQQQELAYNVFCLGAVYFLPLTIISVCYACIFYEISKNSKENSEKYHQSDHSRVMLRRSDQRPLARARRRTLRMTVTIVTVFACCWLPYATMTLWYMLDRKSAVHVSARVQDLFFIMAVSNSCMDPLVYGSYIIDPRTFKRTIRKIFCIHVSPSEIPGPSVRREDFRARLKEPIDHHRRGPKGLMFSRGCGASAMRHRDPGPEQKKEHSY